MSGADRYVDVCRDLARQPRRWLVTGVAGFIGSALAERLLELGQSVVGLDNFMTGFRSNLADVLSRVGERAGGFQLIEGDIRDRDCCALACRGVDYVLHQAALGSVPKSITDPWTTHTCNVDGFVNVALAARTAGVGRVVFASSSAVYGDLPAVPHVESRIGEPLSPYALSKRVNEQYASTFGRTYGVEFVGLRYFNVFGRRQDPDGPYAAVIPKWIGLLLDGRRGTVFGDGSSTRDYCSVDDVVQANLLGATSPRSDPAAIYNVGSGAATSLVELYDMLRKAVVGLGAEDASLGASQGKKRSGDVEHSQADIRAISAALGFRPRLDLVVQLGRTARWYADRRAVR